MGDVTTCTFAFSEQFPDGQAAIYAMYLLQTARMRVNSLNLAQEPGIGQESDRFLLKRLRAAVEVEAVDMISEVEVDESFIGGKEAVLGMRE